MPTLQDFEKKIAELDRDPNNRGLAAVNRSRADRSVTVTLGRGDNNVVPVEVTFNPKGEAQQIYFPNQERAGGTFVEPSQELLATLLRGAGRKGENYLGSVSEAVSGERSHGKSAAALTGDIVASFSRKNLHHSSQPLSLAAGKAH